MKARGTLRAGCEIFIILETEQVIPLDQARALYRSKELYVDERNDAMRRHLTRLLRDIKPITGRPQRWVTKMSQQELSTL